MTDIKVNSNWDFEEVETPTPLFAVIYKHELDKEGYVDFYSEDEDIATYNFEKLCDYYIDINASEDSIVYLVQLPNTDEIKEKLDKADLFSEMSNSESIELVTELLQHRDCVVLVEWQNEEELTEAKKKKKKRKKRRKTPKVTYMTGWPWYNDRMFNRHNGTEDEDAGEDAADSANDAIGGGESVGDAGDFGGGDSAGDFGGGDGGGMGESLVSEAVDYWDQIPKMKALNNGTRGFNAKAASNEKLRVNRKVCIDHNYTKALAIVEAEMKARGILPQPTKKIHTYEVPEDYSVSIDDFNTADFVFLKDNNSDSNIIISNIISAGEQDAATFAIICLIFAVVAQYTNVISAIKDWILNHTNVDLIQLKQIIADCSKNEELIKTIDNIIKN